MCTCLTEPKHCNHENRLHNRWCTRQKLILTSFSIDNVVYTGVISNHVPPSPDELGVQQYETPIQSEVPRIEVSHSANGAPSNPQPYEVPLSALLSSSVQSIASQESQYIEMGSDTSATRSHLSPKASSASQQQRNGKTQVREHAGVHVKCVCPHCHLK